MPEVITIEIRQGLKATKPAASVPVQLERDDMLARYHGTLSIGNVFHHIEAIEVEVDRNGRVQRAVSIELDSYITAYYKEHDGAPLPVEINGKPHFVVVEPFSD